MSGAEGDRLSLIARSEYTIYVCAVCGSDNFAGGTDSDTLCGDCGEWMNVEALKVRPADTSGAVAGTPEQRIAAVLNSIGFGAERHDLARRMLKLAQDAHAGGQ